MIKEHLGHLQTRIGLQGTGDGTQCLNPQCCSAGPRVHGG